MAAPRKRRKGERKKIGRPTKCTPAVQAKICELSRRGRHDVHIAALVGIGDQTLDDWVKAGEKPGAVEPFRGFARAYRAARAEGEVALQDKLETMADNVAGGDPATLRWMLSKKNPKVYGDRTRLEHTGAEGGPVQVASVILMPPEEPLVDATTNSGDAV